MAAIILPENGSDNVLIIPKYIAISLRRFCAK
jgi:hypothetical protein